MSCYGCGTGFGAFKKEHGCKNCGFAFCSKCVQNKLPIPKLGNEKHKVCMKCFNILTGKVQPKEDPARYSPPENYKKRVAALEARESGHVSSSRGKAPTGATGGGYHSKVPYKGMSQADQDIEARLEKLKEKTPAEIAAGQVSSQEIGDRLARIKGMDPARYNKQKPTYQAPDRRTQQEQLNDLLDEISSEVELDSRLPDPVQEISARLAKLKEPVKKPGESGGNPTTAADADENNLNKLSMRDSQTFDQNISTQPTSPCTGSGPKPAPSKQGTSGEEEISVEEMNKIISEAAQELDMDARRALQGLEEDKEIMKKLQEIKQRRKQSSTDVNKDEALEDSGSENADSEDEDVQAASIIRQALEESRLDEALARDTGGKNSEGGAQEGAKKGGAKEGAESGGGSTQGRSTAGGVKGKGREKVVPKKKINTDEEWYDPDELPYCCICTEDAVIRCIGCDHDLYCDSCFKEGHKELGLTDHAFIKYIPPEGNT